MKRFLPFLAAGIAALASPSRAADSAPAAVDGFSFVKRVGDFAEYRLDANDLDVLLSEDHSAPVLTFMVTFHVGSRNEVVGTTGATHLLEHMMFKGSEHFNAQLGTGFDTMMDKVGGINNATTWLDRTNYYENLPSNHLDLAVQLEADRMRGLLLREEDRRPEMTVVRNEFERGENDPAEALDKEVNAAAFIAHPYHHPTIGWRSDIEKVPIAKLREFYDTFYWPNNATVTVIGDFAPARALESIKKYFGAIPRSPHPIPQVYTEEPAQSGPRRVIVRRPGEVGVVEIGYKIPPALHPDHAPLEVLGAILSDGKTSRLYRAVIDTNLAINADAAPGFFHDNTLFGVSAVLAPDTTHEKLEQTLRAEFEKVKKDGVSDAEVSRAINKLLAQIAYRRDGSFAMAGEINEDIAVGEWTYYYGLPERLKSVTAADVQRVARAYLNDDQSTTGWFIPQEAGAGAPEAEKAAPGRAVALGGEGPHYYREPVAERALLRGEPVGLRTSELASPGDARGRQRTAPLQRDAEPAAAASAADSDDGALVAPRVHRRTIAGLDVLTLPTSIKDVVTIRGVVDAGDVFNPPENSAIADLTAGMLDKGTVQHDKFAVAELLEQAGASLSFASGTHTLAFAGKCLRKDLPLVLGLLGEQLRHPRFDPAEFDKLKQQLIGQHRREMEDTNYRAENAFDRAIYPEGHPNRPPADDKYLADIAAATLDQVKAFHAANYGPVGARLVAVGDIDDAAIDRALADAFRGWQGGHPIPGAAKAPLPAAARIEKVDMPGKTSVSFIVGQPSELRYSDPDYQALNMATSILGSGFFSARLLDIIRNREGLTYGIGARLQDDTYADGTWLIRGTFAPELLEKGAASTRRELQRFATRGVTQQELDTFKVTLTGSYKVALSTTGGLAAALLNAVQRGYGPEWVDEYPRRLQALTLEQVNGAIEKYLRPESMITVMAGTLPESAAASGAGK